MKPTNIKNERLSGSIYSISLILFVIIALGIFFLYLPDTLIWMIGTVIVAAIIHFLLYFLTALYIESKKERPFVKKYNKIMELYEQTDDPELLYEGLINIVDSPTKIESKNAFNLSMSTALHRKNRSEEGLIFLDKIEITDKQYLKIIEEQRNTLKGIK